MIATVDSYAPGFAASVLGRQIKSPLDLERDFGLVGGDIFHGKLTLDQLFSARPMLGHADYRGPLEGPLHVRRRHPPGRRRHRRAGAQCGEGRARGCEGQKVRASGGQGLRPCTPFIVEPFARDMDSQLLSGVKVASPLRYRRSSNP